MNRRTAEIVLIAGVLVLAISVAASTLDSTRTDTGGGGFGGTNGSGVLPQRTVNASGGNIDVGVPAEPFIAIVLVGVAMGVYYLLSRPKRAIPLIVGAVIVFGLFFLLLDALMQLLGGGSPGAGGGLLGGDSSNPGVGSGNTPFDPESFELLAVVLLGAALVGIALRGTSLGDAEPMDEPEEETAAADVEAIARSAGRAADRIEGDATVDNEVYRAWREMTGLLDGPDPETSTPGEFATAAVDAGMDPEDVRELTVLFEEVRYGTEEPTVDREERAIESLRRIETYAEDA